MNGLQLFAGSLLLGTVTCTVQAAGPGNPDRFPIDIAAAEARAAEHFAALDTDGDGLISREEFLAGRWHGPGRKPDAQTREARRAERETALFERLDLDGDGQLSREEFDRGALRGQRRAPDRAAMFDRLDRDGDGYLSRQELPDPVVRLRAMDTDRDGMVTREEAEAWRQARQAKAD